MLVPVSFCRGSRLVKTLMYILYIHTYICALMPPHLQICFNFFLLAFKNKFDDVPSSLGGELSLQFCFRHWWLVKFIFCEGFQCIDGVLDVAVNEFKRNLSVKTIVHDQKTKRDAWVRERVIFHTTVSKQPLMNRILQDSFPEWSASRLFCPPSCSS